MNYLEIKTIKTDQKAGLAIMGMAGWLRTKHAFNTIKMSQVTQWLLIGEYLTTLNKFIKCLLNLRKFDGNVQQL